MGEYGRVHRGGGIEHTNYTADGQVELNMSTDRTPLLIDCHYVSRGCPVADCEQPASLEPATNYKGISVALHC